MLRITIAAAAFALLNYPITAPGINSSYQPSAVRRFDGCQVKVLAKNAKGGGEIAMETLSSVDRGGVSTQWSWGAMNSGGWVVFPHNQTDIEFLSSSTNACAAANRYRIVLKRGNVTRTLYFPSATTYTSDKILKLGDLARHF